MYIFCFVTNSLIEENGKYTSYKKSEETNLDKINSRMQVTNRKVPK
jgi:hypothetical protein